MKGLMCDTQFRSINMFQFLIGSMKVTNSRKRYAVKYRVSIPYRFNERTQQASNFLVKTTFQFLIGSMKVILIRKRGCCTHVSIPYRFNERKSLRVK